jgi:transcriptional regulator with XRE-family HTH domain
VTDQDPPRTTAHDVLEIRFLSGLTWEELGELFGVSRRSVHNWANGEALKADNIILVGEALQAVKELRRASSVETRLALLSRLPSGERPLDLLRARRWQDAIAAIKALPAIPVPPSISDPSLLHPTAYFGALSDRPASTSGQIIRGRSRRIPRHTP